MKKEQRHPGDGALRRGQRWRRGWWLRSDVLPVGRQIIRARLRRIRKGATAGNGRGGRPVLRRYGSGGRGGEGGGARRWGQWRPRWRGQLIVAGGARRGGREWLPRITGGRGLGEQGRCHREGVAGIAGRAWPHRHRLQRSGALGRGDGFRRWHVARGADISRSGGTQIWGKGGCEPVGSLDGSVGRPVPPRRHERKTTRSHPRPHDAHPGDPANTSYRVVHFSALPTRTRQDSSTPKMRKAPTGPLHVHGQEAQNTWKL